MKMEKNNKPIRVLIVDGKLISGGVEAFLMNIYRRIDKNKIQFDFLVHYQEKFFYDDEIEALGGKIYRLSFRNDNNVIKYYRDLKQFFRSHKEYSIVWGHMDGLASIYLRVAKKEGVHCTIAHSHITSSERSIKGIIKKSLRIGINNCTDYRFACSTEAGEYLYGKHSFNLIHNAIDLNRFSFNEEIRKKIRNENNWTKEIVIGHVGRFFAQKNHSYLIELFKRIVEKDDRYVLCLCGDGEDRPLIEKKVFDLGLSDKVVFTGNIPNINEYYQAFDVFVLPSLYEGLPVSGIEAQTSGLKCIFANTITPEVNIITENVKFLPITDDFIEKWGSEIIDSSFYVRNDRKEEMEKAGYSIEDLVNKLTRFFEKIDSKSNRRN